MTKIHHQVRFALRTADLPVELAVEDNDAPPVISVERKTGETNPIDEGDDATFVINVVVDPTNDITTTGAADDIDVLLGVEQTGSDFFDSPPSAEAPLAVTIPANIGDDPTPPVEQILTTDDDFIDEADGSYSVVILNDSVEEGDPSYTASSEQAPIEVMVDDNDNAPVIQISDSLTEVTEGENAVIVYEIYSDPADPRYTTTAAAHDIEI